MDETIRILFDDISQGKIPDVMGGARPSVGGMGRLPPSMTGMAMGRVGLPGGDETAKHISGMGTFFKRLFPFVGFMGGAFGLLEIARNSKIISSMNRIIVDILSMMVDIFLMPLVPLFAEIVKLLMEFVPIIEWLSKTFLAPIVAMLLPILRWISGTVLPFIKELGVGISPEERKTPITAIGGAVGTGVLAGILAGIIGPAIIKWIMNNLILRLAGLISVGLAVKLASYAVKVMPIVGLLVGVLVGWLQLIQSAWYVNLRAELEKKAPSWLQWLFAGVRIGPNIEGETETKGAIGTKSYGPFQSPEEYVARYGKQHGIGYVPRNMLAYLHQGEKVVPMMENIAGGKEGKNKISTTSFQQGIGYVPKNMWAYLHQGEKVIPMMENIFNRNETINRVTPMIRNIIGKDTQEKESTNITSLLGTKRIAPRMENIEGERGTTNNNQRILSLNINTGIYGMSDSGMMHMASILRRNISDDLSYQLRRI